MTSFESFFQELISDEHWYETMQMIHRHKPIKDTALLVYGTAVGEGTLTGVDIKEHRNHVHNKLAKTAVKIQNTIQTHQPKEAEAPKEEIKVFATDEERDLILEKWKQEVNQIKMKPVPRLSHKQIAEEGDWLPKKKGTGHDPGYYHEHLKFLHECRVKTVRDRNPTMSDEEIEKYIVDNFPPT